jgi:8-oxo-dGTP pyrophosphatase MutT (NUDIX family)
LGCSRWRGRRLTDLARALAQPDVRRLAQRIRQLSVVNAVPAPETRLAAVTAVLRVVEDEPELLFIKRALAEGDPWSGHVAFPGGRIEPGDESLEHTAIRETHEELALDLTQGRMLGRLDDLAPRSASLPPIIVRPFVAVVASDVELQPSREVAATFWVPLAILRDPGTQDEHVMTINGARARFPAYRVSEHLVWGMTERIVRQLLTLFES